MNKRLWLCLGESLVSRRYDQKPCLFSQVEIVKREVPIYVSSRITKRVKEVSIYCIKKHNFIHKFITQCPYFSNTVLGDF